MPELPEVETIRRGLENRVEDLEITEVRIRPARVFQVSPRQLAGSIEGDRIHRIERLGKFLLFRLQEDVLVIHLGMTGQLTLRDPDVADSAAFLRHPLTGLQRVRQHAPDRHTHLELLFENGSVLMFRDVRKFGKVHLLSAQEAARDSFFSRLGLEPFSDEYEEGAFLAGFKGRKLAIKSLLLDQSFVAGVGNIYADEALFAAGLHPLRRVSGISRAEKVKLFGAVKSVLEKGIHFGGTSMRDYVNSDGRSGSHQEELMVYGRRGKPCRLCDTPVEKIVVSQRGTHYCPACQPKRRARRGR